MSGLMTKMKNMLNSLRKILIYALKSPSDRQKNTYFSLIRTIAAIGIAIIITMIILIISSKEPFQAISTLLFGPMKNIFWIGEVLRTSVPLIFTGLAASIMLKCKQFNMIGEGSFYIGGFIGAIIAIYLPYEGFITILIACLAAVTATGLIGFIPAILKAKWNVSEFVVSLMMNFILLWVGMYFLQNFFRDEASGDIATGLIPFSNRFSTLIEGTYASTNLILALAAVTILGIFLYKTKYGYTLRMTGNNLTFTKFSGLAATGAVIYSQVIGSSIAGLGGAVEILGSVDGRFAWKSLPGYGFDGFIVAILANNNPFFVPIAAIFFAYLRTGATLMSVQTDVASELVFVIQAIIIIIIAGRGFMSKLRKRMLIKGKEKLVNEVQK